MRRVLSGDEEAALGSEWGAPVTDVKFPKTHPMISTVQPKAVFVIPLSGDDE